MNNLGVHHLVLGQYAEAEPLLLRAQQVQQGLPADAAGSLGDQANLIANLAQVAHGLEQLDRAEALYAEAQRRLSELFPDGGPDVAILLNNRALLALDRGDREQALALLQQSLAMRESIFAGDHPLVLGALIGLGRFHVRFGDGAEAEALAARAAAMAQRMGDGSRAARVHALSLWADALLALDRAPEADARLLEAEVLLEADVALGEQHAQALSELRSRLCAQTPGLPGCNRG